MFDISILKNYSKDKKTSSVFYECFRIYAFCDNLIFDTVGENTTLFLKNHSKNLILTVKALKISLYLHGCFLIIAMSVTISIPFLRIFLKISKICLYMKKVKNHTLMKMMTSIMTTMNSMMITEISMGMIL